MAWGHRIKKPNALALTNQVKYSKGGNRTLCLSFWRKNHASLMTTSYSTQPSLRGRRKRKGTLLVFLVPFPIWYSEHRALLRRSAAPKDCAPTAAYSPVQEPNLDKQAKGTLLPLLGYKEQWCTLRATGEETLSHLLLRPLDSSEQTMLRYSTARRLRGSCKVRWKMQDVPPVAAFFGYSRALMLRKAMCAAETPWLFCGRVDWFNPMGIQEWLLC
jgi:hypothetical protein